MLGSVIYSHKTREILHLPQTFVTKQESLNGKQDIEYKDFKRYLPHIFYNIKDYKSII
jgi:hypothetical protein